MNNSENPLDMWCEDSKNNKQVFHYDTMINSNRIYYKLSGREGNFIATAMVNEIDRNNSMYKTKFDEMDNLQKYSIDKLGVFSSYTNIGVMTVMLCDILLTILDRKHSYKHNFLIYLRDISNTPEKDVNVYQSVLPNYKKRKVKMSDDCIEVKGDDNNDVFYLFSKNTRTKDIEYYRHLREKKLKKLNIS